MVNYNKITISTIGIQIIKEIKSWKMIWLEYKRKQKDRFNKVINPRGYPENFPTDYATFSKYTFMANVCFNIMNFISTQVLINSLGMNISKSSGYAFSAGLNYVIKEGFGQAGMLNILK